MSNKRNRGWRRERARIQIRNQFKIYQSVTSDGNAVAKPSWRKFHALSCGRANCGFCRNPRFNRNSGGTAKLTLDERKNEITYREYMFSVI